MWNLYDICDDDLGTEPSDVGSVSSYGAVGQATDNDDLDNDSQNSHESGECLESAQDVASGNILGNADATAARK